ncbi:hypothetical protein FHL15_002919 [Xylaria flabelliformis]|uniref:Uncharacterized protein n=1 Tax=Xylaria flabelliformis TaxID=2512241 RepID=A0A553I7L5_9PEZI|nr:hypothetical protein FHL15_002919 [Xylaria flabelliformis]
MLIFARSAFPFMILHKHIMQLQKPKGEKKEKPKDKKMEKKPEEPKGDNKDKSLPLSNRKKKKMLRQLAWLDRKLAASAAAQEKEKEKCKDKGEVEVKVEMATW